MLADSYKGIESVMRGKAWQQWLETSLASRKQRDGIPSPHRRGKRDRESVCEQNMGPGYKL